MDEALPQRFLTKIGGILLTLKQDSKENVHVMKKKDRGGHYVY
jgi:hypothetical protein